LFVKVSGHFKRSCNSLYAKVSDAWELVTNLYKKVSGEWLEIDMSCNILEPDNVTDLYVWHDLTQHIADDGDNIYDLLDYSGYGTAHKAYILADYGHVPKYKENIVNTNPAMLLSDGTATRNLYLPTAVSSDLSGSAGLTVFVVCKTTDTTLQRIYQTTVNAAQVAKVALHLEAATGKLQYYIRTKNGDSALLVKSALAHGTDWGLWIADTDLATATSRIWINDTATADATTTDTELGFDATFSNEAGTDVDYRTIGGSIPAGYPFYGYIGEIVIYNRQLTDTEREGVRNYLIQKWYL
jgi:hypothetical protein